MIQRGPYAYSEKWSRKNIKFSKNKNELSFTPLSTFTFIPELSNGTENDTFFLLNVPLVAMLGSMRHVSSFQKQTINFMIKTMKYRLFIKKSVSEFIGGYEDPILKLGKFFRPNDVKTNIFSLLNGKNATEYQYYTINTGNDNINDIGKIIDWNDKKVLDYWYSSQANMINGSDGTAFSPYLKRTDKRYSFSPDICRSYYLEYLRDDIQDGINVYDFHLSPDIFNNLSEKGFCPNSFNCLPNGVFNVSQCYGGNGYISQPHFLNADKSYLKAIDGLKPNTSKHDMILKFEPLTGVALNGHIRFQVNFLLQKSNYFNLLKNLHINNLIFPVMWFDEEFKLDEPLIRELGNASFYMKLMQTIVHYTLIIGIITSLISMFLFIFLFIYNKQKKITDDEKSSKRKLMGISAANTC